MMQDHYVRYHGVAVDAKELDAALRRLRAFEATPSTLPARWLHAYVLREGDGRFGLACVFQADCARTLDRHSEAARLPAAEILPVAATRIVRRFAPTMVYLIRRRAAWTSADRFERAAELARQVGDEEMAREVSWLSTYVVREHDGSLGASCLYQAVDAQALRRHAVRAGMPAHDIEPVIGRIVYREPATADDDPAVAAYTE